MSFIGKVAIIGIVGAACYWQFVIKKEDPEAKLLKSNPIEAANKDYVEHRSAGESTIAGKKATILQDEGTVKHGASR